MYLPYSYKKFGKLAVCANYYTIRHLFDRGSKLMLIKKDDKYISGSLLYIKKNIVFGTHTGIIKNKINYLKLGLGAAPYYYSIKWAKKIGAKSIDFGTCKSILNDGLLQYKKKWGSFIRKTESSFGIFAFRINNYNSGINSFLLNNPFMVMNNNHLEGLIIFDEKDKIIDKKIQHFLNIYDISGIKRLTFIFIKDLIPK